MNNQERQAMSAGTRMIILGIACVALLAMSVLSVSVGTIKFSLNEILLSIFDSSNQDMAGKIIRNIRGPRIINGLLVGMNLAVAGVLLQGILRNPMASPNIIGVNAGAGLAAVVIMTIVPAQTHYIPLAAFLGAMLAAFLIFALSVQKSGNAATIHLVLAGVAVSTLLKSITNGFMMLNSDVLGITFSWTLGSLSGRGWSTVSMILPYSIGGIAAALFVSPKVNLFSLGEEMASSIGLRTGYYRIIIMTIASVLAGSAVSAAGTIGFVGLIAPHIAKLLIGNDHRYLVPLSALLGGTLLVVADTLARTIFQPVELSVGIVTAILGAPFFLFLLNRTKKR